MSANTRIVNDFIEAWNARDLDRVMTFFTPDCVYHNIPARSSEGQGGDRRRDPELRRNVGRDRVDRTDRFLVAEKWISLSVMGAFEITNGKISAWRDYFDMAQFQKQMPQPA